MEHVELLSAISVMLDEKLEPVKNDTAGIKAEVKELKEETSAVRDEVREVKEDVGVLRLR